MEWLKDKKNAPIVAAIAVVVIIGVGLGVYFMMRGPSSDQPSSPGPGEPSAMMPPPGAPVAPGSSPGMPPGSPGAPPTAAPVAEPTTAAGQPSSPSAPATGKGAQVASVTPMETWRSDPFQPIGYKPPRRGPQPKPHIWDFPYERLPIPGVIYGPGKKKEKPEIQQPSRRMSGLLLNDRVYAIIESNGASQVVQPGEYTTDRLAMVVKIESDRVVLKTVDDKPRYITVKMASSPTIQPSVTSPTSNYVPPNPGRPGRGAPGLPPPMPMPPAR